MSKILARNMSLYDGLWDDASGGKEEVEKKETPEPAAKRQALPSHVLLRRKRAPAATPAPTTHKNTAVGKKRTTTIVQAALSAPSMAVVEDPYDPEIPNDYAALQQVHMEGDRTEKKKPTMASSMVGKDLLAKLGWQEGEGLGKRGQGIVRPIDGVRLANGQETLQHLHKESGSRVVLLRNVCGAGDVDEEVRPDLLDKCASFGIVAELLVWEAPEEELERIKPTDHVRCFVVYETQEAADKAKLELNGRFFAGSQLEVDYFPMELFMQRRFDPADFNKSNL